MAHVACEWGAMENILEKIENSHQTLQKNLAITDGIMQFQQLINSTTEMFNHQMALTSTSGHLGNLANMQQQLIPKMVCEIYNNPFF